MGLLAYFPLLCGYHVARGLAVEQGHGVCAWVSYGLFARFFALIFSHKK